MVIPGVDLTLAAAVPLVATSRAHKLGLPFLAALALGHVILVERGTVATGANTATGRDDHAWFAVVTAMVVAGIVYVTIVVVVVTLVDYQPVHAVLRFVVHVHKVLVAQPLKLLLLLLQLLVGGCRLQQRLLYAGATV